MNEHDMSMPELERAHPQLVVLECQFLETGHRVAVGVYVVQITKTASVGVIVATAITEWRHTSRLGPIKKSFAHPFKGQYPTMAEFCQLREMVDVFGDAVAKQVRREAEIEPARFGDGMSFSGRAVEWAYPCRPYGPRAGREQWFVVEDNARLRVLEERPDWLTTSPLRVVRDEHGPVILRPERGGFES